MGSCVKIKITKSKICSGDMTHQIRLVNRTIAPPAIGSINPQTIFTDLLTPWAAVESSSLSGGDPRRFDGINIEDRPTHNVYIFFDASIWPLDSDNTFVILEDGRRLRIVGTNDLNEMHETIKLSCTERGVEEFSGSEA